MNSRIPIGLIIAVFLVVAIALSLRFAPPINWSTFRSAGQVQSAPSDIYARLDIAYDHPPIQSERYEMDDRNGTSSFSYTIVRYAGPRALVHETIKVPPEATYEVSFFFGQLVSDGVWDIVSQQPRGNTSVHYTVTVRQTEDYRSGSHVVTFTDPHYWAVTAGREFHIHLSRTGPLPNILTLQGNGIRDPRYLKIVDDFLQFGPPAFRAAIAHARAQGHD